MKKYYCTNCGADLGKQSGFVPEIECWECTECGTAYVPNKKDDKKNGNEIENSENKDAELSNDLSVKEKHPKKRLLKKRDKERKSSFLKGKKNLILGVIIAILVLTIIIMGMLLHKEKVEIGRNHDDVIGENYDELVELLDAKGFTKIIGKEMQELSYNDIDKKGEIQEIFVDGENDFVASQLCETDMKIVIYYLGPKRVELPYAANEIKSMNYSEVVSELEELGFCNIKVEPKYDLVVGWLNKENEVAEISIDKNMRFEKNSEFPIDAEIIIKYHAFGE